MRYREAGLENAVPEPHEFSLGIALEKSLDDFLVAAKLLDISPDERLYTRQEYTVRAPLLKGDRT